MQQFLIPALAFALFSPAVVAAEADPCSSQAIIGDIDLSKPLGPAPQPPASDRPAYMTFVPIETALPGLENAPRAFHGIAGVPIPGPGLADLPEECRLDALLSADKPVAP